MTKKGKFIVIDGIDGCGGQTQTKLLFDYLGSENVFFLAFPEYSTDLGQIVDKFLHKKIIYQEKAVELLVYYTNFLQFKPEINKALEEGKTVICDRYFTSTLAFQSRAGNTIEEIMTLNSLFNLPIPDICILLDITAEESQRRKAREKMGEINLDRNESNRIFLDDIRKSYLNVAKKQIFCKWEIIDGEKPIEEIFNKIKEII